MDISYLLEYIDPLIMGICLMVGFALKYAFEKFPNRFIPLSELILGTILALIVNRTTGITLAVVVSGMVSGLASTGLYEVFRNLIGQKE